MAETFCSQCFIGCKGGVCYSLLSTKVYCSGCGRKVYLKKPHQTKNKKGGLSVEGDCPNCRSVVIK